MRLESKHFPKVKKVNIVYNNPEGVMDFDVSRMYSLNVPSAKSSPCTKAGDVVWICSETVEAFGRDFGKRISKHKDGELLLYILDSFDSLATEAEIKRFEKAQEKGEEQDGSYNLEKQKYISQFFRMLTSKLEGKDCLLFIISQTRSRIGVTFGKKKYRAGGDALDFYTHQVCWLAEIKKLTSSPLGEKRVYGVRVRGKFERNKTAKPFREAEFTILYDYGVDDLGSMLDWLHGPEAKKCEWDGQKYSKARLIAHIEDNNLEGTLRAKVVEKWNAIEDRLKPDRKGKY